ncbi:hypothetical protein HDV05_002209 [Chytridiales sp. JEL 0842]|nr:hypothetical protein HDV05_002209 [Chytridiales sp. JEL 0842]
MKQLFGGIEANITIKHTICDSTTSKQAAVDPAFEKELAPKGGPPSVPKHTAVNIVCRICLSEEDLHEMFAPCKCKGSCMFVHRYCLERWRLALQTRGNLMDGQEMRCESCLYPYKINHSILGRIFIDNAQEISNVTIICSFLISGLLWHSLDPLHTWFATGHLTPHHPSSALHTATNISLSHKPWKAPTLTSTSAFLQTTTCGYRSPPLPPCLPSGWLPVVPLLAPLAVLGLYTIHGTLLTIFLLRTVPKRFAPGFYALHLITYLTTGSLLPYTLFDILYAGLLEYFAYMEKLIGACLVLAGALASQLTLAVQGATGGEVGVKEVQDWDTILSRMLGLGKADGVGSLVDASEWAEGWMKSWSAVLTFQMVKVVCAAWLYTVKYYYTIILLWAARRTWERIKYSIQYYLVRTIRIGFQEYKEEDDTVEREEGPVLAA